MKRVSIKKRIFVTILLITILSLVAVIATSVVCMFTIRNEEEKTLIEQLDVNFTGVVKNKAEVTDAWLEHYERYIELIVDYIHNMYEDRDELTDRGYIVETSLASTPVDEFAMQRAFASEDITVADAEDELRFFSNLESIFEPIAKENDGLIDTIYIGTEDGLMVSYDKYSYLSAVEEGKELYYDYFQSSWYPMGLESDGIFYTDLYVDSQGRGLTVTIGSPFYDENGKFRGSACADFDITALYDEMISLDLGEDAFTFAVDKEKNIISPEETKLSKEELTGLTEEDFNTICSGDSGILERDDAFYIYAPVKKIGWTLCSRVPRSIVMASIDQVDKSISTAWLIFCLVAAVIVFAVIIISQMMANSITRPIKALGNDMEIIAKGNLDYKSVASRNDEIGDMSNRLNEMVEKLKNTLTDLIRSQQHAEKMSELANKDALTGVRNRTAYDEHMEMLNDTLVSGEKKFGFAMADLNYLKVINDTCGHDKGNIAIQTLCHILCEVFAHSPVFRIGGDEFVIILKGHDYENCEQLADEFNKRLDGLKEDPALEEWEKVSAALGYAKYDEKIDGSVEDVSIRADQAMYDKKKEMKAAESGKPAQ